MSLGFTILPLWIPNDLDQLAGGLPVGSSFKG